MKKSWNKYKWIFLILNNAFPFAVDVMFYPLGGMVDLCLFLPIFAVLTALNYRNCPKVIPYILYQAFMLVCIICTGYASTYLYYHNISNDSLTPLVGELMVLLGAGINIVATIITAAKKTVMNKKPTQNNNG